MARYPRYVPEGGALVEVTCRTFQGRFLLRPRQDLNDIVVGALAHFLGKYPSIGLVGVVVLSTHLHLLLAVESQEDLSDLMRDFGSKTAREVNKLYGRGGSLFSSRYRSICVTHEPAAEIARLEYLLAHDDVSYCTSFQSLALGALSGGAGESPSGRLTANESLSEAPGGENLAMKRAETGLLRRGEWDFQEDYGP